MKFLVPNYSCLQNLWIGGYRPPDPRSLCPLSSTEFVEPPPTEQNSRVHHCLQLELNLWDDAVIPLHTFIICFFFFYILVLFYRPDWPWGPHNLLYSGYRVFPGGKTAGTWRWQTTPSSAKVKERVELYLYSPSGPSCPVLGWTLPLHLPLF